VFHKNENFLKSCTEETLCSMQLVRLLHYMLANCVVSLLVVTIECDSLPLMLITVRVCLFAACGICDIQHSGRCRSSQTGPTGACCSLTRDIPIASNSTRSAQRDTHKLYFNQEISVVMYQPFMIKNEKFYNSLYHKRCNRIVKNKGTSS
jgi:hypothetical protein